LEDFFPPVYFFLVPCLLVVEADLCEVDDGDCSVVVDVASYPSIGSCFLVVDAEFGEVNDVDDAVFVDVVVGCFGVGGWCGGVGVSLCVLCGDGDGVGAVLVEGGGVVGVGVACGVCHGGVGGGCVWVGDVYPGVLYAVGVGDGGGDVFPAVGWVGVFGCAVGECGVCYLWWCGVTAGEGGGDGFVGVYGDGEWVGVFLAGGYVSAPAVEGVAGVGLCGEGDVGVLCVAGFLWVDVDGSFSDCIGGEVVAWYGGAVDVVDVEGS